MWLNIDRERERCGERGKIGTNNDIAEQPKAEREGETEMSAQSRGLGERERKQKTKEKGREKARHISRDKGRERERARENQEGGDPKDTVISPISKE